MKRLKSLVTKRKKKEGKPRYSGTPSSTANRKTEGNTPGVSSPIQKVSQNSEEVTIHSAARDGIVQTIYWLCERGVDVNSRDSKGRTPLMIAAIRNRKAAVAALLLEGADRDMVDNDGNTALMLAQEYRQRETANMLKTPHQSLQESINVRRLAEKMGLTGTSSNSLVSSKDDGSGSSSSRTIPPNTDSNLENVPSPAPFKSPKKTLTKISILKECSSDPSIIFHPGLVTCEERHDIHTSIERREKPKPQYSESDEA